MSYIGRQPKNSYTANEIKYKEKPLDEELASLDTRFSKPDDVDTNIAQKVSEHDSDPNAHPELTQLITSEVDRATLEADRSEAASEAAAAKANIYSSTEDALLDTVSGDYFLVVSDNPDAFSDLYYNDGGAAVHQGKSTIEFNALRKISERLNELGIITTLENVPSATNPEEEYSYAVVDEEGNVVISIDSEGDVKLGDTWFSSTEHAGIFNWLLTDKDNKLSLGINSKGNVETNAIEFDDDESVPFEFLVTDSFGRTALIIDENGNIVTPLNDIDKQEEIVSIDTSVKNVQNTDYIQFFTYGQSLSRGSTSRPIVSDSQPYNSVTFNTGVLARPVSDGANQIDFKPLVEESNETPTAGTANGFARFLSLDENLLPEEQSTTLLGSAPGQGGRRIEQLNKGTVYWQDLITSVQSAYDIAQSKGRSHSVHAMTWTQGEANYGARTSVEEYKNMFIQMHKDFCADVKAITKQTFNPGIFSYQVASHRHYGWDYFRIALAQYYTALEHDGIYLATPMYQFKYTNDNNVHLTNESSRRLGYYYGLVMKKVLVDGIDWKPLQPNNILWQGRIIDIQLHLPHDSGIVIDEDQVAPTFNKGFDIWDDNDNLQDIISSVEVIAKDRIRITLSSTPGKDWTLSYARGRDSDIYTGYVTGPRGNIRDSQGVDYYYTGENAENIRLDNWLVMFESKNTG